jgi:methionine-rich copper-binding protein CopC
MQTWISGRRVAAGMVGLVAVLVLPAAPATAHARLTGSDPAAGSMITAPLSAIMLTFSGPVKAAETTVTVTGADAVNKSTGPATAADVSVQQPVGPLPTGAIKVDWRTVSADGHTIQGTFTFTNAAPEAPATPSRAASSAAPEPTAVPEPATAGPAEAAEPAAPEPASNDGGSTVWWVVGGVVLLGAIAGGAVWYRRRSG